MEVQGVILVVIVILLLQTLQNDVVGVSRIRGKVTGETSSHRRRGRVGLH